MTIDKAASPAETRADELEAKSALLRDAVERNGLGGIRLRGQDWFAWATCGGSSAVLLASERGVAEIRATADGIRVLTSAIEGTRLREEELRDGLELMTFEWADTDERESFVLDAAGTSPIASDLPSAGEIDLPGQLVAEKRRLRPAEIGRYRGLGPPPR